jgi:hypothetical protein
LAVNRIVRISSVCAVAVANLPVIHSPPKTGHGGGP